jgi:hypothetical protein
VRFIMKFSLLSDYHLFILVIEHVTESDIKTSIPTFDTSKLTLYYDLS